MRHSSYHTPSLPSRIGRVLLVLLCSAGVLSGGFLLLCGLGAVSYTHLPETKAKGKNRSIIAYPAVSGRAFCKISDFFWFFVAWSKNSPA